MESKHTQISVLLVHSRNIIYVLIRYQYCSTLPNEHPRSLAYIGRSFGSIITSLVNKARARILDSYCTYPTSTSLSDKCVSFVVTQAHLIFDGSRLIEQRVFDESKFLREICENHRLEVYTDAEAARAATDSRTDTQTKPRA